MQYQQATRFCSLETMAGRAARCPEEECPFWEPGGAVLGGRCAFEQFDTTADAALADWLLEIRERLASADSAADAEATHSLLCHLLNESSE